MKAPRMAGRDGTAAKINAPHSTRANPPQQAPVQKPDTDELRPYAFLLKHDKGRGIYLTPTSSLDTALAELLRRWPNELLSVKRGA